jgi:hypothetical protein
MDKQNVMPFQEELKQVVARMVGELDKFEKSPVFPKSMAGD